MTQIKKHFRICRESKTPETLSHRDFIKKLHASYVQTSEEKFLWLVQDTVSVARKTIFVIVEVWKFV